MQKGYVFYSRGTLGLGFGVWGFCDLFSRLVVFGCHCTYKGLEFLGIVVLEWNFVSFVENLLDFC